MFTTNSLVGLICCAVFLALPACKENTTHESRESDADAAQTAIPKVRLQRVFAKIDIQAPLFLVQAPGDNTAWYVLEKQGRILKFDNNPDASDASVFLDITDRVDASKNEGGFLGMAFHPQYSQNRQVYLSYTKSGSPLVTQITRVTRPDTSDTLDKNSEQLILSVDQPYSNHNGGNIMFGPDGYLYIGLGDGGSGGDPLQHGQNTKTLLGAMLRIDVNVDEGSANSQSKAYQIPADNPFASDTEKRKEIYLWGLRNPWRWSFDSKTGELWIADVGQNSWEEISVVNKPGNLGWNIKEGTHCFETRNCDNPSFIEPVAEYGHADGCSVTGGYVYRGQAISTLQGVYLFGDFCSGIIWFTVPDGKGGYRTRKLMETDIKIASFAESNERELFVLDISGKIFQFMPR